MKDDKVIVVFGGSFNPPLNSHFSLAEQIISEYKNVEKVIFVPVSEKYEKEGLLNNKYRYEMLKCVCDKNENSRQKTREISGQNYMVYNRKW